MMFAGTFLTGTGMISMALCCTSMVPLPYCLSTLCAAAALAGFGTPFKDIPFATLRQLHIPNAEMAAAMRAYLVTVNSGLLIGMLVAPSACARIGSVGVILLAGAAYLIVATTGWIGFSGCVKSTD
jgi:hypothetical protein